MQTCSYSTLQTPPFRLGIPVQLLWRSPGRFPLMELPRTSWKQYVQLLYVDVHKLPAETKILVSIFTGNGSVRPPYNLCRNVCEHSTWGRPLCGGESRKFNRRGTGKIFVVLPCKSGNFTHFNECSQYFAAAAGWAVVPSPLWIHHCFAQQLPDHHEIHSKNTTCGKTDSEPFSVIKGKFSRLTIGVELP